MANSFDRINRREFLAGASASALLAALHEPIAWAAPRPGPSGIDPNGPPLIQGLRLLTAAPFAQMKAYYHGLLGFPVLSEEAEEITFGAGLTPITFVKATPEQGKPFYHFAFNIPENKLLAARKWQLKRTPLIVTPPRQRDPKFPDDVRHFRNWNAHSVFFWDPADNLLEYIARHDLKNTASDPKMFATNDILYASEIGFIVDDQPTTATKLNKDLGLQVYPQGSSFWWAMGDERGLLLCIPRRKWGTPPGKVKTFSVFPTQATIRGQNSTTYTIPDYPYDISVQ